LLLFCPGGCEFNQITLALVEYGLLDDSDFRTPSGVSGVGRPIPLVDAKGVAQRVAHARQIYVDGVPDERIGGYLRSRGINLISPILRFTEQAPHRTGARLPAMLAPVVDADDEQIGVHMTYLRRDGTGKADLPKEFQREFRGRVHGGAIRLAEHDPNAELIIAEGIETALAAMELFSLPGWSAVFAGGLKTLELPPEARRVLIAADHDEAGRQCALAARDRWAAEGRAVRVKVPPTRGQDFADLLLGRRRNAARP
jgi:hypothetical protein